MWNKIKTQIFKSIIPVINVHGIILPEMTQKVVSALNSINKRPIEALAVSINSPGGNPVQSQIIANKLRNFANTHHIPLYTFAKDYATSGGYYILSIGDEIYADKLSIVGNIGVYIPKLHYKGLVEMGNLQIKQLHSQQNSFLEITNPFTEMDQNKKQFLQELCEHTHQKFKQHVLKYRHQKLKGDQIEQIMSGQTYSGEEGVRNGLVDECGCMVGILSRKYPKKELDYGREKSFWSSVG